MSLTKLKLVAVVLLAVGFAAAGAGISAYRTEMAEPATARENEAPATTAAQTPPRERDPAKWVDQRMSAWQPTKAERRIDDIGWAKDIRDAERLARKSERPVFLFNYGGVGIATGRC